MEVMVPCLVLKQANMARRAKEKGQGKEEIWKQARLSIEEE